MEESRMKRYRWWCILLILQIIVVLLIYFPVRIGLTLLGVEDENRSMLPAQREKHVREGQESLQISATNLNKPLPFWKPSTYGTSQRVIYVARPSTSVCPEQRRPENVSETFQFQTVDGRKEIFVFSAFFDERDELVRVIAITFRVHPPRVLCHLWYEVTDGLTSDLIITPATVEILDENHGLRLSAAYFHCPLPRSSSDSRLPYAVSVTTRNCHHDVTLPSNVLRVVTSVKQQGPKAHNFTVCIKPVYLNYSRAHEVVESIEMNRLLGATKFTVYMTEPAPNVLQVLKWYQARGIVEMINWPIHLTGLQNAVDGGDVHDYGHIAAKSDCLFRNRKSTRYMVTTDWDEFLVPKSYSTWMALIQFLDQQNGQAAAEYGFPCLFFHKDLPYKQEDFAGKDLALKYRSNVLLVNKRQKAQVEYSDRAKYIFDPEQAHVAGIHYVLKHRNINSELKTLPLPQAVASAYHYRFWGENHDQAVMDDDMHRFKEPLLRRVKDVWEHLPNVSLS